MDIFMEMLLAEALAGGMARHLAAERQRPPPDNFFELRPESNAWRKLKEVCKKENTVICFEITDDSHPPSRQLQGPVMDLAREMDDVPFCRVTIAPGETFDELREDLGGIKVTPTLLVVFHDIDDKLTIYKAEGVLEVRRTLQTNRAKEVMQMFLKKRKEVKIAEKLAEHFTDVLRADFQERQRERDKREHEAKLQRQREDLERERAKEAEERRRLEAERKEAEERLKRYEEEQRRSEHQAQEARRRKIEELNQLNLHEAKISLIREKMQGLGISWAGCLTREDLIDRLQSKVPELRKQAVPARQDFSVNYTSVRQAAKSSTSSDADFEIALLKRRLSEEQVQKERLQEESERLRRMLSEKEERLNRQDSSSSEKSEGTRSLNQSAHWRVKGSEIQMTNEVIGVGGWAEVRVAHFRGSRVAAKKLHQVIISDYNLELFQREMEIAAQIRHPNLLQFMGATTEGHPIFLSELMPTSLRKEMEKGPFKRAQILSIGCDVACGLNYLHLWVPNPIIHRDVSSPNVLLERSGPDNWKAKLSDYGSANFLQHVSTTVGPGCPAYAAPESCTPRLHTPKMDVYSFGVLVAEMCRNRPPGASVEERRKQLDEVKWPAMKGIILWCINDSASDRPTTNEALEELRELKK